MGALPRWYAISAVGLAATLGAAVGAGWTGVHPGGSPGGGGLGTLFAAAAAAGTAAAVRPRGILPRRRLLLVARAAARIAPEVVVGVAGAAVLTGRLIPCLLVILMLRGVRAQAFVLARRVATVRVAGNPISVLRARAAVRRWIPAAMAAMAIAIFLSGLDHAGGLLAWRSAPLCLAAGAAAVGMLVGVEHEALAARFRQARATVAPDLGLGWWRAAGGWIVLLLAVAALLPPPPAVLALGHVQSALENWVGRLLLPGATPGVGAIPTGSAAPAPPSVSANWRERAALLLTLALMLALAVWAAIDLWRGTRRLRLHLLRDALADLLEGLSAALGATLALLVGFAAALGVEVRGGGWLGAWLVLWDALRAAGAGLVGLASALWLWTRLRRRGAPAVRANPPTALGGLSTLESPWRWDVPAHDPRRRVRESYRAFITAADRAGLGRSPSQTPTAHRRTLEAVDPESSGDLRELTEAYQWARFSPHPVTGEQVEAARRGWQRLAARLAAWGRRGRGA